MSVDERAPRVLVAMLIVEGGIDGSMPAAWFAINRLSSMHARRDHHRMAHHNVDEMAACSRCGGL
jgi:hypothetical protein